MADAIQGPAIGMAPPAEPLTHNAAQPASNGAEPRLPNSEQPLPDNARSPSWTSAPSGAAGTWGRSLFAPANKKAATTYLAQCYEQMTMDMAGATSTAPAAAPSTADAQSVRAYVTAQPALTAGSINEPHEYVFIFTNPRSGNQQGRALMDMALHSFRLRDRPDVQVQIYDITDKTSLRDGLHYIRQLQMHQGDRLMRCAFPELFDGRLSIRPSPGLCPAPGICPARHPAPKASNPRPTGLATATSGASVAAAIAAAQDAAAASAAAACAANCNESDDASPPGTTNNSSVAWDEWITDVAALLQSGLSRYTEEEATRRLEAAQDSVIKLHVWSAGGDGTVSSTLEAMMDNGIDVERVYFSSIPFGTGNDFADALGWGRSVPGDGVGGSMKLLNKIISERLEGYTCKLDIYEVTITTYDGGHIKHVERDMHKKPGMGRYKCLMIDYLSIGVQGFVGSSFEMHRPGSRSLNILMYTAAAAKWVFLKRFPPINEALESISTVPEHILADTQMTDADRARWLEAASEEERKQVLLARVAGPRKRSHGRKMKWTKEPTARRTATAQDFGAEEDLPVIQCKPIEIDIQNVARFWGRDIDVWDSAHDHGRLLSSRTGVADSSSWTPQYAGDGKLEMFAVRDIGDYALNQLPGRDSYRIGRLAQMGSPLVLHFRPPESYPPRSRKPLSSRRGIEPGLLYAMCDGEFIEMYHPRDVIVSRRVTLKAVGRSPDTSRIVRDTIHNDGIDAVQMDATAAANKTRAGQPLDVSSYVASPFQRFFGRRPNGTAATPPDTPPNSSTSATGTHASHPSETSACRRSTLRSIRDSIRRSVYGGSRDIPPPPAAAAPENLDQQQPPLPLTTSLTSRSQAVRMGKVPESPLRQRQSLSDIRRPSDGPHVTRVHSKSLDLNNRPPSRGSSSGSRPSSSESSASSRSVETGDESTEVARPVHDKLSDGHHPGCLHTTGKELVDFVDVPATPLSTSPNAASWDNPCTPS
ncbi:hypothetical protein H4R19_003233 [Coemansia spiralis]|nr:hypothetical protein H4R19_003233 [Coemansia spiralis]